MKIFKYLVLILLVFTSCKTKKYVIDSNAVAKEMSAKRVVKKHLNVSFGKETVDAKLSANFNNGKTKQSLSVYLRITKGKEIWLKGSKFITVFKARITPKAVEYYSPYAKNYFKGDFKMLENVLGTSLNYTQLENLFLGQAVIDLKENKQEVNIVNNTYVLKPQTTNGVLKMFFGINPGHFKLDFQKVINSFKNQALEVEYPSYSIVDKEIFPKKIDIRAKQGKKITKINFTLKSVEFNKPINTSFSIPENYKHINL